MSIQYFEHPLAKGISTLGSAIGKGIETYGKKKQEIDKQQKIGSALQSVVGESGEVKSLEDVKSGMVNLLKKNVPLDIVNKIYEPQIKVLQDQAKEQARIQGIQNLLQSITGSTGIGDQGTQETGNVSTPGVEGEFEGTIYDSKEGKTSSFSDQQLDALASSGVKELQSIAERATDQRKENRRQFESDRKFHTEQNKDSQKKFEASGEALPLKKSALVASRNAIESGDVGPFSFNAIADAIGGITGDAIRTASGAALNFAGKENLIANITRVSARAQNKFLEQQISLAFPKTGQSKESNLTVQTLLEQDYLMAQAYHDEYARIAQEDINKYGFTRQGLAQRAREASKVKEDQIIKSTSYTLREIQESEKGDQWLQKQKMKKVTQGTPLTSKMLKVLIEDTGSPEAAFKRAKQFGYVVYSEENMQLGQLS